MTTPQQNFERERRRVSDEDSSGDAFVNSRRRLSSCRSEALSYEAR